MKGIEFSYPTKPDVKILDKIDIDINTNQVVALVGQSGSGKSSIISLVERFYDPNEGSVSFNGQNLKDLNTKWYHQSKLAIVQQEPNLFTDTVRENIIYGIDTSKLSKEELDGMIRTALDAASCQFMDDPQRFPDGLDTMLGERGATLSGGQKQRIAIARALIRKPRVLLLDEATSALDADSEHTVQKALDALIAQKNLTVIVIAHRLSTVRDADKIIVMKRGKILEQGSHDELLTMDGAYKKLVQKQLMTAELGE